MTMRADVHESWTGMLNNTYDTLFNGGRAQKARAQASQKKTPQQKVQRDNRVQAGVDAIAAARKASGRPLSIAEQSRISRNARGIK